MFSLACKSDQYTRIESGKTPLPVNYRSKGRDRITCLFEKLGSILNGVARDFLVLF